MFRLSTLTYAVLASIFLAEAALCPTTKANVFGHDDRQPVVSREYPWRCIGLVVMESEDGTSTGTGFLIGRNLVLTNCHCAMDEATETPGKQIYFIPNRIAGVAPNAVHVNKVWLGAKSLKNQPTRDWAVLRLDSNLGDDLGYLKLSSEPTERGVMVAYSGDYREQETAAITPYLVRHQEAEVIFHDADGTRGSSGGPLLAEQDGKPVVVALNFGERRESLDSSMTIRDYTDRFANLALPVSGFLADVTAIVDEENDRSNADDAQQARRQLGAQQDAAAYATLTKLIEASPENCWARLLRGDVSSRLGRRADAAQDYQSALRIAPHCVDYLLVRAEYCYNTGEYDECIAVASRIIAASPSHKTAIDLRTAASAKRGQAALAVADATAS